MILNLLNRRHIKNQSDIALIHSIKANQSKQAIGELYNRYGMMMFGVALKYLNNKMDAEDVLMQTFEKLAQKVSKSDIKHPKNWLYTIIKNECLMKLRAKKQPEGDIEKALLYQSDDQKEQMSLIALKEQQLNLLEQAITELKHEQKTCIELFYLKQMCYDAIAKTTGFELKKVKSYIQNGKRNLKLILDQKDAFKQI